MGVEDSYISLFKCPTPQSICRDIEPRPDPASWQMHERVGRVLLAAGVVRCLPRCILV